jgi:hypothetical protein
VHIVAHYVRNESGIVCVFGNDVVEAAAVRESEYSCLSPLFRGGHGDVIFRFGERMSKLLEQDTQKFEFFAPCAVTHVRPVSVVVNRNFSVTVAGSGFAATLKVRFGSFVATSVHLVTSEEVLVTAPELPSGRYLVSCSLNDVDFPHLLSISHLLLRPESLPSTLRRVLKSVVTL